MMANAPARTASSARVECANPAPLTPSQIPYAIVPAIGMQNVASAQYFGDSLMDLMVDTAFFQDAGNGGGVGTGNGGAATEGAGGGGNGTV
jgi:hypothetical protein